MPTTPIRRRTLVVGGDTITIDATGDVKEFDYNGSGTLLASTTISPAAIVTTGITYHLVVRYNATFTLNGNSITIFSHTLSQEQASGGNTLFDCTYVGGAWTVCVIDSSTIEPKGVDGVAVTTLSGAGGTVTLIPNTDYQTQELIGSGTLAGNYVYTGTGTQNGQKFRVIYNGTFAATGSNITIFGYTLTQEETVNGGITVDAEYNGTTWTTTAFKNPFIANQVDMVTVEVSFETGEQIINIVNMGYKGTLYQIEFQVTKTLAGVDDGTIDIDIAGTPIGTVPTLTFPSSTVAGTGNVYAIVAPNTFNEGDYINLTCAKTTPGGRVRFILYTSR